MEEIQIIYTAHCKTRTSQRTRQHFGQSKKRRVIGYVARSEEERRVLLV